MGIRLSDSVVNFFVWCGSYVVIFFFWSLFCFGFFCACLLYLFMFFCFFIRIASSSNQRITAGIVKVFFFFGNFFAIFISLAINKGIVHLHQVTFERFSNSVSTVSDPFFHKMRLMLLSCLDHFFALNYGHLDNILMHWTIVVYITPLPGRSNYLWWYMGKVTLCNVYYFSSVHSFSPTNCLNDHLAIFLQLSAE